MSLAVPPGLRRRTLRLPVPGAAPAAIYFITIWTAGRECIFGSIGPDGAVMLSEFGWMVQREWLRTGFVRPELELDAYVVMPNHVHAVLAVAAGSPVAGAPLMGGSRVAEPGLALEAAPPHRVLGAVLAGFKAMCTVQINHRRGRPGAPVWQRGYVERLIGSEAELDGARRHIEENPARWIAARATLAARGTIRDSAPAPREP